MKKILSIQCLCHSLNDSCWVTVDASEAEIGKLLTTEGIELLSRSQEYECDNETLSKITTPQLKNALIRLFTEQGVQAEGMLLEHLDQVLTHTFDNSRGGHLIEIEERPKLETLWFSK